MSSTLIETGFRIEVSSKPRNIGPRMRTKASLGLGSIRPKAKAKVSSRFRSIRSRTGYLVVRFLKYTEGIVMVEE